MKSKSAQEKVAIGYARVSTTDQLRGFSIENQEEVIRAWCQRNGITLATIYRNDSHGESGKNLERASLQAAFDRIAQGDVGWLVVYKSDRLSRSFADTVGVLAELEEMDVEVVAPGDGLDQRSGGSRLLRLIHAYMNERERVRIIGRIRPGLAKRVEAGLPLGRPPLGYRLVGERREQRLEPDPERSGIVEALFVKAAASGWGPRRLSLWAAETYPHLTHPSGKPFRFTTGTVRHLVGNPVYIGTLAVSVGERRVIRVGNHEALITDDLFRQVQSRSYVRQADRVLGLGVASSWLGGIARCARCGAPVTWRRGAGGVLEDQYVCQSRFRAGTPCSAEPVPSQALDNFVGDHLSEAILGQVAHMRTLVGDAIEKLPGYLDDARSTARRFLDHLQQQVVELDDQLQAGSISVESYGLESERLSVEENHQRARLDSVDGWTYLSRLMVRDRTQAPGMYWMPFSVAFAALDSAERRRLLRACVADLRVFVDEYPFFTASFSTDSQAFAPLIKGYARTFASFPGFSVDEHMTSTGWIQTDERGREWVNAEGVVMRFQERDVSAMTVDETGAGEARPIQATDGTRDLD